MRKLRSILSIVLVLCMLLSTIPVATAEDAVGQDNEAPVIHLDTLELLDAEGQSISGQTLQAGETVHIRFKVTDESEIHSVSVMYNCNGAFDGAGSFYYRTNDFNSLSYDPDTQYCEGELCFYGENGQIYFGLYELFSISAEDVYGNSASVYSDAYDLSAGTFRVVGDGYVEDDTTGPAIDHADIKVDTQVAAGEKATISVSVTDASSIYAVQVEYGSKNTDIEGSRSGTYLTFNPDTNRYEGEIAFNYFGVNKLITITATDANRNTNSVVNTEYPFDISFAEDDRNTIVRADVSNADVYHGEPSAEESNAPVLELSSITLEKRVAKRDEVVHVSVRVSDASEIQRVAMSFVHERSGLPYYLSPTSSENGVYTFDLPTGLYGQWKLAQIEAIDAYGNATMYHDNITYPYYGEDAPAHTDLSAVNYYVGVIDEATGVSVSDASMGDNTAIAVTENELSGDKYSQMLEEGCTAHAFYDVSVSGDRGTETDLLIPAPNGLAEGDAVRVVHLKADGTTENLDTTVENGLVAVTVNEFSPFLLETGFTPAPTTYEVTIDACMGAPFNISAPPPLGNDEPSSYTGEATLSVEAGTTLADLGIEIWHDAQHEPYFKGWAVYTWDPTVNFWTEKTDSNGKPVVLDTATMLGTPITEDIHFEASWVTYTVIFEDVDGCTFDLFEKDFLIFNDIHGVSIPMSYWHTLSPNITISDHKNGTETFYGWDVYERIEDPNNPDSYLLNPVEGPVQVQDLFFRHITHDMVCRANWTGKALNEPQDNIIIDSNNGSSFKLTDKDGTIETFPGYFGLNSDDFTDEFSNFSDLGLASIELDTSTPFACWEVFRPVYDDNGNIVGWDNEKDEYGNNRILPTVDLILSWPIKDGVKFLAQWNAGGNSSGVPGESAPTSGGLAISSDGTFDIYRTNPQNGQVELWGDDASHTREVMDVYVGDTLADFGITDITDIKYWDGKREFLGWEAWSYLPFEMQGETHYQWGLLYNRLFTTQEMLTYPAEDKYIEFVAVWAGDDADYFTNVHFNAMGGTFLVTAYDYTEEGPVVLGTIPMDGSRIEGCKENGQSVKEQFDASYYPNTDPVHEGYTFEGWLAVYEDQYWHEMSDKLYTTEQVVNLPVPKENVQYLAKWKEISMEEYRFGNPYFPYDGSYSELYFLANGSTFNVTVNFNNGSPHSYSGPYIIYTTDSSLTFEESQQQGVVQRTFELADKTNLEGWTTYAADRIYIVTIKKGDKLNVLGENFTVFKAGDEKYEDENGDFIQSEVYVLLKNAKVYSTTMTPEDALKLTGDKFYATVAQWHVASSTLANVKSATCTAEGYTGDKGCANCGEILEKGKVIAKTAHTEVTVAGKAPTCTETGLTEGKKCSVCGTVTVEQTVIAAASHKLTKVAAVAPTYTAAGNIEYYACACGALFADAEGKTATTAEAVKLAQLIKIEETKAEVSTDAVDTAIKEAETTGSITIDLVEVADEEASKPESGSGSDTTTKPAPVISSAALPVASLQKVAEISEETTLTVNMTEVTVTMDAKTLAAVAEQSAGETVTLKVEKIETKALTEEQQAVIEDKEVAVVVSATLISNNVAISDFKGGEVTIALPFTLPEGTEGSDFQVYYVADDGTMTAHETEYKNGCLVFSTTHFSDYVVVNTAAPADPTVPNTGDQSHLLFFTTLLMISAAGIYLASRKMRRA